MSTQDSTIKIGALVPLTRPGWVDAGRQLLNGLELAVSDTNRCGGIDGKPIELLVRDTAADPKRAVSAVDELAGLGVVALAGEYHSVVARAAAIRADAVGLPFLCSSAVLDALIDEPTGWVARLSPQQSRGWQVYADFLRDAGHECVAIAAEPSIYWESGTRILRERIGSTGGRVVEYGARSLASESFSVELIKNRATALLLLIGNPELAASIVKSVRNDRRLLGLLIGAPAGQPELKEWETILSADCTSIPFLRYLPENFTQLGKSVAATLREQLAGEPSFVAFEGYDTIATLVATLRLRGADGLRTVGAWSNVVVNGTRGEITFTRTTGSYVWQWDAAPIQVAEIDPVKPSQFRVLRQV